MQEADSIDDLVIDESILEINSESLTTQMNGLKEALTKHQTVFEGTMKKLDEKLDSVAAICGEAVSSARNTLLAVKQFALLVGDDVNEIREKLSLPVRFDYSSLFENPHFVALTPDTVAQRKKQDPLLPAELDKLSLNTDLLTCPAPLRAEPSCTSSPMPSLPPLPLFAPPLVEQSSTGTGSNPVQEAKKDSVEPKRPKQPVKTGKKSKQSAAAHTSLRRKPGQSKTLYAPASKPCPEIGFSTRTRSVQPRARIVSAAAGSQHIPCQLLTVRPEAPVTWVPIEQPQPWYMGKTFFSRTGPQGLSDDQLAGLVAAPVQTTTALTQSLTVPPRRRPGLDPGTAGFISETGEQSIRQRKKTFGILFGTAKYDRWIQKFQNFRWNNQALTPLEKAWRSHRHHMLSQVVKDRLGVEFRRRPKYAEHAEQLRTSAEHAQ